MAGLRLRVSVRGQGRRPLVLIMGLGGNLDMWDPFERALRGHGVSTVAYDSPGTWDSADWLWPRRMPGIARLVVRLLDRLGYDQVDVLGVSLGGAVAQQLAHIAPRRVRRLVRDTAVARRFFTRALGHGPAPVEVATDKAGPTWVVDELVPAGAHVTEQYSNNRVEADHAWLKARLRPMRGLSCGPTTPSTGRAPDNPRWRPTEWCRSGPGGVA